MNSRTVLLLSSSALARQRLLEVLAHVPGAEVIGISVAPETSSTTRAGHRDDSAPDTRHSEHGLQSPEMSKSNGTGEYTPFLSDTGHFLRERRTGQAERRRTLARPIMHEAGDQVPPKDGKCGTTMNGRRPLRNPAPANSSRGGASPAPLRRRHNERQLANELHDDFGQLLAAMKIDISLMHQFVPPESAQLANCLGSIDGLVDAMLVSVRRILAGRPPRMIEEMGLFDAIAELLAGYETRYKFACRLRLPAVEPALCAAAQTAIFRVVQEIFNNIAKHARATCVDAAIDCSDDTLLLQVSDNGIGMSPGKMNQQGSFGIAGMHERVTSLDGVMTIDSAPGRGTAVSVRIPLPASFARPD